MVEFPFQGIYIESRGDRGVHLDCFLGDALPLGQWKIVKRSQIMEAVRQLYDEDPEPSARADEYFAVSEVFERGPVQMIPGQFCDPVDQFGDPGPEAGIDIIQGYPGNVFDNIVQERGGQQLGISGVHLSDEDFCHGAGMADVRRTGFSLLARVQLGGKIEGFEKNSVIGVCGIEAF